jgi:hypothetical protein
MYASTLAVQPHQLRVLSKWAGLIQFTSSYHFSLRSILVLSYHICLLSDYVPKRFLTAVQYSFLPSLCESHTHASLIHFPRCNFFHFMYLIQICSCSAVSLNTSSLCFFLRIEDHQHDLFLWTQTVSHLFCDMALCCWLYICMYFFLFYCHIRDL